MGRRRTIGTLAAFAIAAAGSAAAAWFGAGYVEKTSREAVEASLAEGALDWAGVATDGLQLILTGRAPDEPARFRAITRAGAVVDPNRIVDAMDVIATEPVAPPRFTVEILRNEAGVSLIGLIPTRGGPEMLDGLLEDIAGEGLPVTNMVEDADHPVPSGWEAALRFAFSAMEDLPRSKVTVAAGRIEVTAVADSDRQKGELEARLRRDAPRGVTLVLDIAAPRPVIAPFTTRFVLAPGGAGRFEACAVDSEAARTRIMAAARSAGMQGEPDCPVALGVPSGSWGEAVATAIGALDELGGGALTLSDADVSLIAAEGTEPDTFERVAAELESALPDIFSLTATLPEPTAIDGTGENETGTPEFVATRAAEGQLQLRGRLYDEAQEQAVLSYGRALFGTDRTYIATRADETLPEGWPVRVLTGLDALSLLASGSIVVQPDLVAIRGITGNPRAEAEITRMLSAKLGEGTDFRIGVDYREELDPELNIPSPEECEGRLNDVLGTQKLSFAPGAAVIDAAGDGQLSALREMLDLCRRAAFEIGGHTDSQGREEMNQELSQQRAEAVRLALIERGVPPAQLVAKGYGEAEPIADNGTEAGREANRRITFTLLGRRDGDAAEGTDGAAGATEAEATSGGADADEIIEDGDAPEGEAGE